MALMEIAINDPNKQFCIIDPRLDILHILLNLITRLKFDFMLLFCSSCETNQ